LLVEHLRGPYNGSYLVSQIRRTSACSQDTCAEFFGLSINCAGLKEDLKKDGTFFFLNGSQGKLLARVIKSSGGAIRFRVLGFHLNIESGFRSSG
jgi:hypothetical protein